MEWISVKDRLPEKFQDVAFIVECKLDKTYNGRRMGGRYMGLMFPDRDFAYHAFSVPGIEFKASHWMPLPEPPKANI